jgi:hypothetical protein
MKAWSRDGALGAADFEAVVGVAAGVDALELFANAGLFDGAALAAASCASNILSRNSPLALRS